MLKIQDKLVRLYVNKEYSSSTAYALLFRPYLIDPDEAVKE